MNKCQNVLTSFPGIPIWLGLGFKTEAVTQRYRSTRLRAGTWFPCQSTNGQYRVAQSSTLLGKGLSSHRTKDFAHCTIAGAAVVPDGLSPAEALAARNLARRSSFCDASFCCCSGLSIPCRSLSYF